MKMYALITTQETAAAETALCSKHNTPELREWAAEQADTDVTNEWHDCSGNWALECQVCGKSDDNH